MRRWLFVAAVATACNGSSPPPPNDASTGDTGIADASRDTALFDADHQVDADPGGGACVGACAVTTATVTFRPTTVAFEHAYFGITSADSSDSGAPELHIEAYKGGEEGCPEQDSPTPRQTLIVTGMQSPHSGGSYSRGDGLAVTLLDFEGILVSEGLVATAVTATATVDHFDDELASVVVEALLDGAGVVTGRVAASRCASLDVP